MCCVPQFPCLGHGAALGLPWPRRGEGVGKMWTQAKGACSELELPLGVGETSTSWGWFGGWVFRHSLEWNLGLSGGAWGFCWSGSSRVSLGYG